MEPNIEQMSDAAKLAECDRWIEEILAEHDDQIEAFVKSGDPRYPHVRALCDFERARRLLLIDQLESPHAECEGRNVETVTTWIYGAILVLSGVAMIALIRSIGWLCHLAGKMF